jgi:predicted ATPase
MESSKNPKHSLDHLKVEGFKSIKHLDIKLRHLNILSGANGSGKSNFIDFFRLMRAMMELQLPGIAGTSLQVYVADGGGSDNFLYLGPKVTPKISIEIKFGLNQYRLNLVPTVEEKFVISEEARYYEGGTCSWWDLGSGHTRPVLLSEKNLGGVSGGRRSISSYIYEAISSWKIYHFHDTGKLAPMRRSEVIDDNEYLRFDGANIAPFLYHLKKNYEAEYQQIVDTIKLVTPFFDDFVLKPGNQDKVRLNWRQKGSDYPFKPSHLSDGTLRFICLVTALLQPDPPSTIIIDEPELGLHPFAIDILAELIQAESERMQIIVSTQSPALVDCFEPEDIIVVNRDDGASVFRRLNAEELNLWLEEYSLGDLWRRNIIAGGPVHE